MDFVKNLDLNILSLIFISIFVLCILHGARKGMLRIIFGIIAWAFLICFVNFGGDFLADYIKVETALPSVVQENIDSHLHKRYDASEQKEAGTGQEAILGFAPAKIKDQVEQTIHTSIDNTIKIIAEELTDAAIKGISTVIVIIVGILLIIIIDKILKTVGFIPGINDVNKILGMLAGAVEGMLIIWIMLYLAKCFPASAYGEFINTYATENELLLTIYNNNVIEKIFGI